VLALFNASVDSKIVSFKDKTVFNNCGNPSLSGFLTELQFSMVLGHFWVQSTIFVYSIPMKFQSKTPFALFHQCEL